MVVLVIDTNILISFFRENPVRKIILTTKLIGLELHIPEYAIKELNKIKLDILKYSGLDETEFKKELIKLQSFLQVDSGDFFRDYKDEAKKLIHDKDVPFFALALKLKCPIWSNEPDFKKQSKVKILNNKEIIELFG